MAFRNYLRRVGHRIKAARLKCGLRQVDVEELIGISARHYQKIEAGRVNVTLETIYKLARLYQSDVDKLMPKQRSDR